MTVIATGYELPVPSTELSGPVHLHDYGADVVLTFRMFSDGLERTAEIRFAKVRAYRYTAEVHCTAEQIDGAYDTLVEVPQSAWAEDVRRGTAPQWKDYWALRHYRIFLDSNGCYELLAESWEATRRGEEG